MLQRLAACSLLALVAACPAKHAGGPTASLGVGCPTAAGVYVASYVQPTEGEQGHTGWVLPLHDTRADSVEGKPTYAPLDAAAALAAGVPQAPPIVWLMPPNAPMCKATIGTYYAATIEGPPANVTYGVELSGCAAPQDPSDAVAIALASDAPPSECKVMAPRPVATRLGEVDKDNHWSRPTKETPIPPAFAKAVPAKDCAAPACEALWSIAQVEIGGQPVAWAGAINWLAIPAGAAPDSQCSWKAETFSGFFLAGPDGAPVQITDGQDHPLALTAALTDASGRRMLLAEGTGEYTVYDVANGAASVARHLVWLVAGQDAYAPNDRIGPDCPRSE